MWTRTPALVEVNARPQLVGVRGFDGRPGGERGDAKQVCRSGLKSTCDLTARDRVYGES